MNDELPPGWAWATLGDVCDVVGGATPKTKIAANWGDSVSWITPDDLSHHSGMYIDRGRRSLTREGYESCSAQLMPAGSVLFTSRAPIGYVAVSSGQVCTSQGFKSFVPRSGLRSEYLYWYLRFATPEIRALGSGTTFKEISKAVAASIWLPVPPNAEQRRIVAAIEEHFSRLDFAEAALEAARSTLQALRRSVLATAFSGRLTNPTHTTNTDLRQLPESWRLASIADVAEVHLGRQRAPRHHTGEQMRPYLRAANVTWDGISLEDVKTMNFDDADFARFRLTRGDILLNEASGSPNEVGKPAIWDGEIEDCCFQNTLLRLRPRDLNGDYLYWYCYSSALSGRFGEAGRGVNIRHLGKRGLAQFPIPLGPRAEQELVVAAIEEYFSRLDAAEAALDAVRTKIAAFRRSVLAEAFAGRLVPQDPDDEPAAALLARLAAERPARPTSRDRSK